MRATPVVVMTLALSASAAQAAREPIVVEPSSTWVLDYADERCSLIRQFGSGDSAIRLQLDSYGTWNGFWTIVSGPLVPRFKVATGFASYRFSGDPEQRVKGPAIYGSMEKEGAISFAVGFSPYVALSDLKGMNEEQQAALGEELRRPFPEFERSVSFIEIDFDRGSPVTLQLGSMGEPLAAMRACVEDLYRSWGIDPAIQKSLSRSAKPIESTIRRVQRKYPLSEMMNGINAFVPVRLRVDASGQAQDCVVQSTGAPQAFRDAVCDTLASKFEPALDGVGKPTASLFTTSVIYSVNGWR